MNDKINAQGGLRFVGKILGNTLGNLALGFVAAFLLRYALEFISTDFLGYAEPPHWTWQVPLGVMIGVIFCDPIEAWREKKPLWRVLGVFFFGMIGFVVLSPHVLIDSGSSAIVASDEASKTVSGLLKFWPVLLPLAMMPFLFGSHAVKRFEQNKGAPINARVADAALEYINTSGPVVMLLVMGVASLAYWIIDPPLSFLLPFLGTILVAIIIYCAIFYDGSEPPVTDELAIQPRARNIAEGLSKFLSVSVSMIPAALFMCGLIWVAMAFWTFEKQPTSGELQMAVIVWPLIKAAAISLLVVLGGTVISTVLAALCIDGVAQLKGMGIEEIKMRSEKFNEILFFGTMGKMFHATIEKRDE